MTLRSAQFLQDAGVPALQFHDEFGWRQISAGLRIVSVGYGVMIVGSILSGLLVWQALAGQVVPGMGEEAGRNLFVSLTALAVLLTAVCSYGLVMLGEWRCMMYAPPRHSAREVMYVCFNSLLASAVLNCVGVYLEGGQTYAALQQGWEGVRELNVWSAGNLMQLTSIGLGVLGSLVFSQYLRNVADCFHDRRGARAVDFNLGFIGLMIGGSLGAYFGLHAVTLGADTLPWLAGGWLLCFTWHLWLVLRVRRCVANGVRTAAQARTPKRRSKVVAVLAHTLSGLHRLARGGA